MNTERMHPLLRDWLHCMAETEAMQASVLGERRPLNAAPPEPRGPNVCCRCGRTTRKPPRVWARVGGRAWCYHCQRTREAQAQIAAAREAESEVPVSPG